MLPKALVPIAFSIIEKFDKDLTDTFFSEAINFHLGTKELNITELVVESGKRNMSLSDAMAIVEEDGW